MKISRLLLASAVSAIAFCAACSSSNTPGSVVKQLITAADKGDADQVAEVIPSEALKALGGKDKLKETMSTVSSHNRLKSVSITKEEIKGDNATVEAKVINQDDQTGTLTFKLIKENGNWKVDMSGIVKSQRDARETAARTSMRTIITAEVMYSVTIGNGKYGTLEQLGAAELIDSTLASGKKGGYTFTATPVEAGDQTQLFDVTARPEEAGMFGTGNRSFYSNESAVIYEAEGANPPSATPEDRVPKNGKESL